MKKKIHPSQFAGQKKLSTEHYLVKMLDATMRAVDNNDSKAVIALFIDWDSAYNRVDHKLGMEAFIKCGVRPALLPLIANYFQDRSMVVHWNNATSDSFSLPGSTAQGSSYGPLEFIAITNDNTLFAH